MKALLSLVLQGPDKLAQERKDSPAGGAKEGAVLAGLQLLRTTLERDMEVVNTLKATQQNGKLSDFMPCDKLSCKYLHLVGSGQATIVLLVFQCSSVCFSSMCQTGHLGAIQAYHYVIRCALYANC